MFSFAVFQFVGWSNKESWSCRECQRMQLQVDRFCRSDKDSEEPILYVADIPFFKCPNSIASEVKFLFGKILAVQQGFIRPPKATIFWLSAVREIMSATSIAAKEAEKEMKRKRKNG